MIANLTIKEFLEKTACRDTVPGGESVSALNGIIATALTEMVANRTIGNKKYAEVAGQMKTIATEASIIRERLLRNTDPGTCVVDDSVVSPDAAKEKVEASMQVAEEIASVMEAIIYVAHKGDRTALSDVCVAMLEARSCVLGALINVRIYLGAVADEAFAGRMKEKAIHLASEANRIETKLFDWIKVNDYRGR
ncbi:cyclodeaminase/cyclohydrolase family protein [Parabacteroides sp.]